MSLCQVVAPTELTLPTASGSSPTTWDQTVFWATRNTLVTDDKPEPGSTWVEVLTTLFPLAEVSKWIDGGAGSPGGAEVYNYPVYFELNDLTKTVPWSDPAETWQTWGQDPPGNHAPTEIPAGGGLWYRSNLYGAAGLILDGSVWSPYISQPLTSTTGIVRVITIEQYQAIQAANAPPE